MPVTVPPCSSTSSSCKGCGVDFPSKNAVFRHLKETNAVCLSPADYEEFLLYVVNQQREKVIVLYGYWIHPSPEPDCEQVIRNGDCVSRILMEVMEQLQADKSNEAQPSTGDDAVSTTAAKLNRSYGHISRSNIVSQEDGTGAITEVLATKLSPLPGGCGDAPTLRWIQLVNAALQTKLGGTKESIEIRVLGRQPMPIRQFNAETDVSHRRIEYLLPADFLMPVSLHPGLPSFSDGVRSRKFNTQHDDDDEAFVSVVEDSTTHLLTFCRRPSEEVLALLTRCKRQMQSLTTQVVDLDTNDEGAVFEKERHDQKRQRNRAHHNKARGGERRSEAECHEVSETKGVSDDSVTDNVVSDESKMGAKVRRRETDRKKERKYKKKSRAAAGEGKKKEKVLRRKRYHNFTPTVMAHEFLAYRRMNRFYHRATLRFDGESPPKPPINDFGEGGIVHKRQQDQRHRPFLSLSMSGDLFLTGQVCRSVGLFIALARGVFEEDFVDCVFDEKYPHLVPTPPAPTFALYAGDVFYINCEGRARAILTPRNTGQFENGWKDERTIQSVCDWQAVVRENAARAWLDQGVDPDGRLIAEKEWTETVLLPWAERAREQLKDYRLWKQSTSIGPDPVLSATLTGESIVMEASSPNAPPNSSLPLLKAIDPAVPPLFEKVLYYLRRADKSGLWPTTTPKRQLVMMSNVTKSDSGTTEPLIASLSVAHAKAKSNAEIRSSAYAFVEGHGGASGSFSLGSMPGNKCIQPKGNALFPELMKAAFELEVALCPGREPSSTIAVNRNAQFRPHTDSGAGAGQSTSLIVGLGTYSGGELVVEGDKFTIRYKAVEFDGWKQRHWTMPFLGERYSLVWFTPKGCEVVNFVR